MSKFLSLLLALSLFTGCTSSTDFGECIGILDKKLPGLKYEYDIGNIIVAMVFSETLIVPGIVIFKQLECPEGKLP